MKLFITILVSLATLASFAISYDTTTCNLGDFTVTNTANKVSYEGKHQKITIVPDAGCEIIALSSTNSALYSITGVWYSIDAVIPITEPLTLEKERYESVTFYVTPTGAIASATVNFIYHD